MMPGGPVRSALVMNPELNEHIGGRNVLPACFPLYTSTNDFAHSLHRIILSERDTNNSARHVLIQCISTPKPRAIATKGETQKSNRVCHD